MLLDMPRSVVDSLKYRLERLEEQLEQARGEIDAHTRELRQLDAAMTSLWLSREETVEAIQKLES